MKIREATSNDFDAVWPIFREVTEAGETYGYDRGTSKVQALKLWIEYPRKTFVAEEDGVIVGSYYIVSNHSGPGGHVCNCGYMVASGARGRGLATIMCEHSQRIAIDLGYKAMQFNFVASSNVGAVRLWEKLGYAIVGRLPKAFDHRTQGLVDAFVMYKWLEV